MAPLSTWRWILLGPLVFTIMVFTAFFLETILRSRIMWPDPYVGFITAIFVVASTYIIAPASKLTAATVFFVIGAFLAWFILRDAFYPEIHPKAYQPTLIPLFATIAGGLTALGLVTITQKCSKSADPIPNNDLP